MAAQLYTTGPAHVFVAPYGSNGRYLGTCEDAPEIQLLPSYAGVLNDLGGKTVPFDMQYQGEHAMISLDLNRYDEYVYQTIANRPRTFNANTPLGTNGPADVGSLINTEYLNLVLWILFQFGANGAAPKLTYTGGGMPPGYRFLSVHPIEPEVLTMGTKPKKVHVMMHAFRYWSPYYLSFTLYDFNMQNLGPIT